ncbi:Nitrogen regulatory protein P-II [hydrothermal vent metagenome]|uniref:Nitrogen regulatory protein P-II n=1 Tax=hydrothermal vent metagenome TaxID=652676 RepID=A0A3B1C7L6_9ZZZZ
MKEIKAYVKPHKLSQVTTALQKVEGLTGMSVVDVRGFGGCGGEEEPRRMADDLIDYVPHSKIEIVCNDELVEKIVSIIEKAAHTGLRGDGRIFVANVETAIRIQTGERGEDAV